MLLYSFRMIRSQPLRLLLTIGGIALCAVLMLFLMSAYRGVAYGAVEYLRANRVDLWVLQRNQTNILRCSSILTPGYDRAIRDVPGVDRASGVLFMLTPVRMEDWSATLYLTGFDPASGMGGPPRISAGRSIMEDDEIVLDRAFSAKFGVDIGATIRVHDRDLKVVGISSGTNALVIQYAFVTRNCVQSMLGIPGIVTCFLVEVEAEQATAEVASRIRSRVPGVDVYDHATFLENNVQEMEAGLLPFLYTIAALGVIVLTVILSLLLSINILEWRRDFAVLKTLGSPRGFLAGLVVRHAVFLALCGVLVCLLVYFPMVALVERLSPELSTRWSLTQIGAVASVVISVSVLSALIALHRLRRIYPLEAFS